MIHIVLFVAAFIFFLLAALGLPSNRFSYVAVGLACWVLTNIVPAG